MTSYVVANWKSHKTISQAEQWLETFFSAYNPDPQVQVIIAPPAVAIVPLWQLLQGYEAPRPVLAVQDLSPFPLGAYTGAVAAEMVRDLVGYALVGHSERRRYFHETNQEIANKVSEATVANITPILCLDRPYARAQIAALNEAETNDLIIGYGPVEAIGLDVPQPLEKAERMIREIREIIPDKPVLYGGSIAVENAGDYLKLEGVSGLMVGAASLDAEKFAAICRIAAES